MKFWAKFSDLPVSLLITSLLTSALPVRSEVLTPENFDSTIAKGVWFVEHFSPYCPHCVEFAPTWNRLVEYVESKDDPGIYLAQVNCAVHGDLCDEHNVKGYPQMNLYQNGEYQEYYRGRRDYDVLIAYLDKHAKPKNKNRPPLSPPPPVEAEEQPTSSKPDLGVSGEVMELDDKSFRSMLSTGPTFVKFFAPWCGHCKKLAPTWKQLARHMQHKLNIVEVNCDEHNSLCKSQGVQGYPTLTFYADGEASRVEYTSGRKFEQLKSFAEKASAPTIQPTTIGELESHIANDDVVYLFLHSDSDNTIRSSMTQASQVLLGSPSVYWIASPELFTKYKVPELSKWAILAFKDHDHTTPTSIFNPPATQDPKRIKDTITPWLLANRLPTSTELTQDTFQGAMNAPHHPLVVIAAVNKDNSAKVAEKMRDTGKKWRLRNANNSEQIKNVVFAWMDVDRWASWMGSMYSIKPGSSDEVPIVIARHDQLLYYDQDQTGQPIKLTSSSIFSAIEGVQTGKIAAKHSENVVERTARYLNGKMIAIETFVIEHPMYAVFFVGIVIVMVFVGVRRLLSDDGFDPHQHYRKASRLD